MGHPNGPTREIQDLYENYTGIARIQVEVWALHYACHWDMWDKLTTDNGLLIKGDRLVVPMVPQEKDLQDFYENHTGIAKSPMEAGNMIYWPDIVGNIDDFIWHCRMCIQSKPSQATEPLISYKVLQGPWQKIDTWLFFGGTTKITCLSVTTSKSSPSLCL